MGRHVIPPEEPPELIIPPYPHHKRDEYLIETFHDMIVELLFCLGNCIDLMIIDTQEFRERKKEEPPLSMLVV